MSKRFKYSILLSYLSIYNKATFSGKASKTFCINMQLLCRSSVIEAICIRLILCAIEVAKVPNASRWTILLSHKDRNHISTGAWLVSYNFSKKAVEADIFTTIYFIISSCQNVN